MKSISIVGFGPVGISVFMTLLDKLTSDQAGRRSEVEITIIEKSPRSGGKGLVFGTEADCHVLNSPSNVMTLINGKPNDFLDWLKSNPGQWRDRYKDLDLASEEYLPRSLFGLYVEARKNEALALARQQRIATQVIHEEATSVGLVDGRQRISFRDRPHIDTDYILLCMGLLPSTAFTEFEGNEQYFHSPWPSSHLLDNIAEDEDVVILGTRASAIDAALTFHERAHRGKLYMTSRSGHLPRIIGPYTPGTLKFIDAPQIQDKLTALGRKLTLSELLSMVSSEIEHRENRAIDWQAEIGSWLNVKDPYRAEIASLASGAIRPWQSVLSDLYLRIPDLWQALDHDGKESFTKHYLSLWLVFQDAIPLKNAKIIDAMIRANKLEIVGGLRSLKYHAESKKFELLADGPSPGKITRTTASCAVNSTGLGCDITATNSTLLKSLVNDGTLLPDPFGGVQVSPTSFAATSADDRPSGIYVIGDLTRGAWLFTATLGRGRRQGKLAIEDLFERMAAR